MYFSKLIMYNIEYLKDTFSESLVKPSECSVEILKNWRIQKNIVFLPCKIYRQTPTNFIFTSGACFDFKIVFL